MTNAEYPAISEKTDSHTVRTQAQNALRRISAIDFTPVHTATESTLKITPKPLRKAQDKLGDLSEVGEAVDENLEVGDKVRADPQVNVEPGSALEELLTGNEINRDELGKPPLAEAEDSLLDRERISLNLEDEPTEETK